MPHNFYHGKQADVVGGSANFASRISSGFASYGLSSAQATGYQTLDTALQAAFTTAMEPTTRTPVTIEAKNLAIKNCRERAILLSKIIYATPTVDDSQLVGLGLLPRPTRNPVPPMTTPPVVTIRSVLGRLVTARIEAASPEHGPKPVGSVGASVYSFVGSAPPSDPEEYRYEGLATRGTCEIQFPNDVAGGATAWIAAAWVSQRGARGIACTPVQVTIQGGPILAAA